MVREEPDIKADTKAATKPTRDDRGESIGLMEPLLIGESSRHRTALTDLALELAQKSAGFRRSLPESLLASLADLVRAMNCYYSNLIEGHDTHPIDIERALKGDYSNDAKRRDLQLEAKAHIEVQQWIDRGGLTGRAVAADSIHEIHRRFCEALPEDLLWVEDPATKERMKVIPGELRPCDVVVGRHVPVSAPAIPRFLQRFEEGYGSLGKTDTILSTAAAHHRLAWIHPFLDGNGRVARLMSHATLLEALDTGSVWSVARGLARNVDTYKSHLAACDQTRRNDLDGRGHLSEENLAEFTRFFLTTCIDQVNFMEGLMQPEQLRTRILLWAELIAFCKEHQVGLVALEATGGYERLAFAMLWGADLATAIVSPRAVRRFAEAMGFLEKTDRIDSGIIAWFAEVKRIVPRQPDGAAQQ